MKAQEKLDLSQRKISTKLGVKRRTFRDWLSENYLLPTPIFEKLTEVCPDLMKFKNHIKEKLPSNWGLIKGGKSRVQNMDVFTEMEKVRQAKKQKRIDLKKRAKPKINSYIKYLEKRKPSFKALLSVFLLTDGSVSFKNERIHYASKSTVLKDIVFYFLFMKSKYLPRARRDKRCLYHISLSDAELVSSLKNLTSSFKTGSARGQSIEDYLSEEQPTLRFLHDANEATKKESIRIAFSTDGSISYDDIYC